MERKNRYLLLCGRMIKERRGVVGVCGSHAHAGTDFSTAPSRIIVSVPVIAKLEPDDTRRESTNRSRIGVLRPATLPATVLTPVAP